LADDCAFCGLRRGRVSAVFHRGGAAIGVVREPSSVRERTWARPVPAPGRPGSGGGTAAFCMGYRADRRKSNVSCGTHALPWTHSSDSAAIHVIRSHFSIRPGEVSSWAPARRPTQPSGHITVDASLRVERHSVAAARPGRLLRERSRSSSASVTGIGFVAIAKCWTPSISITGQRYARASAALSP
jgi:hypothetical protein